MRDLGEALQEKTDAIVKNWVEAIRDDVEIESAKELAYQSVRDSIPFVLKAIATLLTRTSADDDPQQVTDQSWQHGIDRAEQGYDTAEIVREYRLLRKVIFSTLEPDLLTGSVHEVLQAVQGIDGVIDEVISLCLESYLSKRLQELELVQEQLLLTNQELTRLAQSYKDNLSYLAHELKNPLNSIMGFSELLLRIQQENQNNDPFTSVQLVERMLRNGRQLLNLINNALEISRFESGQVQLHLEPTDVRSLIEESVQAFDPSIRAKGLAVEIDCDRAPTEVLSDPLRLRQIVTNLVSNAIRYTETGSIRVICQTDGNNQWRLIVADTGVGISREDQAQVFKPYFRAGPASNYSPGSTGLGLAIVAQLVELLQGKIELVSQLEQGSTFTVTFPMLGCGV